MKSRAVKERFCRYFERTFGKEEATPALSDKTPRLLPQFLLPSNNKTPGCKTPLTSDFPSITDNCLHAHIYRQKGRFGCSSVSLGRSRHRTTIEADKNRLSRESGTIHFSENPFPFFHLTDKDVVPCVLRLPSVVSTNSAVTPPPPPRMKDVLVARGRSLLSLKLTNKISRVESRRRPNTNSHAQPSLGNCLILVKSNETQLFFFFFFSLFL